MTEKEFYKELMSRYTFDHERIKRQAKRKSVKGVYSRVTAWVPTAAAAAFLIAASVFIYSNFTSQMTPMPPIDTSTVVYQRVIKSGENYKAAMNTTNDPKEEVEMFVSLNNELTINELQMTFSNASDTGDIKIQIVYDRAGSGYDPSAIESLSTLFKVSETTGEIESARISGVKVLAPLYLYSELWDLPTVCAVELPSEDVNDELFVPLTEQQVQQANITIDLPPVTTPPYNITTPGLDWESTTDFPDGTGSSSQEQTTHGSPVSNTETSLGITSDVTTVAQGVQEVKLLDFAVEKTTNAYFINNTDFVVLKPNNIELYRITNETVRTVIQVSSYEAIKPRVAWSDTQETELYITSVDTNGKRTFLWHVSGKTGTISPVNVSAITKECEIAFVHKDITTNALLIRTTSLEQNCLYKSVKTEQGTEFKCLFNSNSPITTLAYENGRLYYAITEKETSTVYQYNEKDNTNTFVTSFNTIGASVKYTRSNSLQHTAVFITENEITTMRIFDAAKIAFSEPIEVSQVTFSRVNSKYFTDGQSFYLINDDMSIHRITDKNVIKNTVKRFFTLTDTSPFYKIYEINDTRIRIQIKEIQPLEPPVTQTSDSTTIPEPHASGTPVGATVPALNMRS